jgi:hypothetical protein
MNENLRLKKTLAQIQSPNLQNKTLKEIDTLSGPKYSNSIDNFKSGLGRTKKSSA